MPFLRVQKPQHLLYCFNFLSRTSSIGSFFNILYREEFAVAVLNLSSAAFSRNEALVRSHLAIKVKRLVGRDGERELERKECLQEECLLEVINLCSTQIGKGRCSGRLSC
jgi:hypothetical protein